MSESSGNDILDQYRLTSNKLRKRFLKKPNVTEAYESFAGLGQQCESLELPAYAGMCWIAAARCEGSLTNITGETSCLIRSARQFKLAEETDFVLGCPSPSTEHLQASLSCYSHAASICPESSPIPVGINLEIVDFLRRINRLEYCENFLQETLELCDLRTNTKIIVLERLGEHFVDCMDFAGALDTFTEITRIAKSLPDSGAKSDALLNSEINSVLLLLILRPNPQKLSPDLGKLLEKYTWGDKNDDDFKACKMTEDLYLNLQSLVLLCQSLDTANLLDLEAEVWPFLSKQQKQLLRILVRIYCP